MIAPVYVPLTLPDNLDPTVRVIVEETVDPRLEDVHAMLRLPIAGDEGLKAGCNFSIADVLFGVIEGVSAVLWPGGTKSESEAFAECVSVHYRADEENAPGGIATASLAGELWKRFRIPMRHTLGVALDRPNKGRAPVLGGDPLIVMRDKESLSEAQVTAMESGGWPDFLNRPTLARSQDGLYLCVEAFYVGARRLVQSVLSEEKLMREAGARLRPFTATLSTINGTVSETRMVFADFTANANPTLPTSSGSWTAK